MRAAREGLNLTLTLTLILTPNPDAQCIDGRAAPRERRAPRTCSMDRTRVMRAMCMSSARCTTMGAALPAMPPGPP